MNQMVPQTGNENVVYDNVSDGCSEIFSSELDDIQDFDGSENEDSNYSLLGEDGYYDLEEE